MEFMIIGTGIDIVNIEKFRTAVERWQKRFIDKIFNPEELSRISEGRMYYQRLAARFAAKEAVIKAVSRRHRLALKDILILNRENGAPYCRIVKDPGLEILLSISHIEEYAVATAIVQAGS